MIDSIDGSCPVCKADTFEVQDRTHFWFRCKCGWQTPKNARIPLGPVPPDTESDFDMLDAAKGTDAYPDTQ